MKKWLVRYSFIVSVLLIALFVVSSCNNRFKEAQQITPVEPFPVYSSETLVNFIETDSIYRVFDYAKELDKLTLLEFYTDWCLPCQIMDETVYQNKVVSKFLNDNFINYKINAEKMIGLTFLYEVKEYPTLLFVDPKGKVFQRHEGGLSQTQLILMGEEAIKLYNSQDSE